MIQIEAIPAFKDNYIWCGMSSQGSAFLVDPGEAEGPLNFIKTHQLKLTDILLTHHHWDHSGGVEEIKKHHNHVRVWGGEEKNRLLITDFIEDQQKISLWNGKITLQALAIPGHTEGHFAFYNEQMVFTGDTLFSAGCGRIFEGTAEEMYRSLQRLAALPKALKIYCGHEYTLQNLHFAKQVDPKNEIIKRYLTKVKTWRDAHQASLPSTMEIELAINPFLRCEEAKIKHSVEKYYGQCFHSPLEVFAALRRWKDNFK